MSKEKPKVFKTGDVVKLKTGGLAMVVTFVKDDGSALCQWFGPLDKFETATFPPEVLVLVSE